MIPVSPYIRMLRLALRMQCATGCPAPVEMVAETISILGKLEEQAAAIERRVFAPLPMLSELPENVIRFRPRAGTQTPPLPTGPNVA